MNRITFKIGDTLQVFRYGKTSNKKISDNKTNIVQSYTFSQSQYEYISQCQKDSIKPNFKIFFSFDSSNCMDCPFSSNQSNKVGLCYTHKVMQYSGFISMLKSILKEFSTYKDIPNYSNEISIPILKFSTNKYIRFGTYGEPSLHPLQLVEKITMVAKNWTGYTHQYFKKPLYNSFFMASTHSQMQANIAKHKFNYRSFNAVQDNTSFNAIICPASKEGGFKSNCANCGLCSGNKGKGLKNIVILKH